MQEYIESLLKNGTNDNKPYSTTKFPKTLPNASYTATL